MKLTPDQLHGIDQALTWLGAAGWAVLLGVASWRRGLEKIRQDPLHDTPLMGERLNPWSILVSLGFYIGISMLALSWTENAFPTPVQPASATTTQATLPASGPAEPLFNPVPKIAADSVAKLLTAFLMLLLLAGGSARGLTGVGLGGRKLGRAVLLAVGGYVLVYPLCFGSAELVDYLLKHLAPSWSLPTHSVITILQSPGESAWATGIAVFSAVIAAPLAEELFFRGILQNVLVNALANRWAGIGLTSLLFGAVHMGSTPQYALALMLLGAGLGFLYQRFGSLWACIFLHVLFNSVTVMLSMISEGN